MEKYTIHAAQQFSEERFTKINIIVINGVSSFY